MTRVLTNTSARAGGRGEKLAYGQSQRVTFGLEFALGSGDSHQCTHVRIVGLQGEIYQLTSAGERKAYSMFSDIRG